MYYSSTTCHQDSGHEREPHPICRIIIKKLFRSENRGRVRFTRARTHAHGHTSLSSLMTVGTERALCSPIGDETEAGVTLAPRYRGGAGVSLRRSSDRVQR